MNTERWRSSTRLSAAFAYVPPASNSTIAVIRRSATAPEPSSRSSRRSRRRVGSSAEEASPMADAALRPDLSLVLERITDGFFALDAQWRISYMNAQARKLLHARQDIIGEIWLDVFPKARGRLFEREYHRAMRDQRPVQFVEYSETAELWFEVKAYPSPDGLSVYFRDVTSRIEAQREVERTTRRQQALIDFGRAALAGTSYDQTLLDGAELVRDMLEASVVDVYHFDRLTGTFTIARSLGWEMGAALDPGAPPLEHLAFVLR